MDVAIVIDLKTVQLHRDNTVTGVVYWDVDGVAFPEIGWNDFVLVVSAWWSDAILGLLNRETRAERLRFMDGPFWVVIQAEDDRFTLGFVDGRRGANRTIEAHVTADGLCRAIHDSASSLCSCCRSLGIVSGEIDRLEESCKALAVFLPSTWGMPGGEKGG